MFPPGALPAGAVPVGNLPPEMMRALQASLAEAIQDRDAARRQFFNGNANVSDDAVDAAIAQFREHLQDPEQASQMMAMLAMASSNEALRYVSYPTQVLGKSCKMVPVMAGGVLLGGAAILEGAREDLSPFGAERLAHGPRLGDTRAPALSPTATLLPKTVMGVLLHVAPRHTSPLWPEKERGSLSWRG